MVNMGVGKIYRKRGLLHSRTNPATINGVGDQRWYIHGKLHRDGDLPAVIFASGYLRWFKHGKLHRDGDQPAAITGDIRQWACKGRLHRINGPAIIDAQGALEWVVDGHTCTSNKEYQRLANISDKEMCMLVLKYGDVT